MQSGDVDPRDPMEGDHVAAATATGTPTPSWWAKQSWANRVVLVVGAVGTIVLAVLSDKVRSTIITVVIAVGACAGIWIGANILFDQVQSRWQRFQTIAFAVLGARRRHPAARQPTDGRLRQRVLVVAARLPSSVAPCSAPSDSCSPRTTIPGNG